MTMEEIGDFVDNHSWREAKSAAKTNPHSYLVRDKSRSDSEFVRLVSFIRTHGYDIRWRDGKWYRYLDFEGHHYWTMGFEIDITIILNRSPFEDGYEARSPRKNVFPFSARKSTNGSLGNLQIRGISP